MKQYSHKEFVRIVRANGFYYSRHNGDHSIYVNDNGKHISIPAKLESVIVRRLIKENNLEINIKSIKKKLNMSDNVPLGADEDPNAPWNEPKKDKFERDICITIYYKDSVELHPDSSEEEIKEAFRKKVLNNDLPKEFSLEELIIC